MALSSISLVTLVQAKNHLRIDPAASLRIGAEYVGVGDAIEDEFSLDNTPVEGSLQLYVDGTLQVEGTDFEISGADITFDPVPGAGDPITATYDTAADADTFEGYDDELIENLIAAATKKAEDYTGRAFIQRELVETHIGDSKQVLKLYRQPIVADSVTITVGGEDLTSWTERLTIGRLYHLAVWYLDCEIVVTYTAGYAATRAATQVLVPDAVAAVLLMVGYLYENRVDMVHTESVSGIGTTTYELPLYVEKSGAKQYLDALRVNII